MLINLLPRTRTIRAADLARDDIILDITSTCISFITIDIAREYDESIFARGTYFDLFEATNIDGVGPFTSHYGETYDLDDEVTILTKDAAIDAILTISDLHSQGRIH